MQIANKTYADESVTFFGSGLDSANVFVMVEHSEMVSSNHTLFVEVETLWSKFQHYVMEYLQTSCQYNVIVKE